MKKTALRSLFLVLFAMGLEALINNIRVIGHPSTQLSALVNSYPAAHYAIYIEFIVLLSMIQLFANYKVENNRFEKTTDGMINIMFERTVIKTVAYILIFTVTVLNFHSNYRKLRKRQIGISIDLTPSNLVSRISTISPL